MGKKHRPPPIPPRPSDRILEGVEQAERLVEEKQWVEARELLEELDHRTPGHAEVLVSLVNVYYELRDTEGYQAASERLLRAEPDNADAALGLAGAYLSNIRPALALHAFRRFLQRWPNHERAAQARKAVAGLEEKLPELLAGFGLPPDEALDVSADHESIQGDLARQRFREAQQRAEALLQRHPHFAPALNNLSLAQWAQGRAAQAAATAQRVLETEPDNVHALSNLTRFLCASGRLEEAEGYAGRLRASTAQAAEVWLKKAEGLSFVGADEGMREVFRQAKQDGTLDESGRGAAVLFHLAAVATLRLGREAEARRYWQRALRLDPGLAVARENLEDLQRPLGERHAPWPFPLNSWLTPVAIADMIRALKPRTGHHTEGIAARAARRYLRDHPETPGLVPMLLDRGDPSGRGVALLLARMLKTPDLLAALRDFGLSQRGPDQMRLQALHVVKEAGLLSDGPFRMWVGGKWTEQVLMAVEVYAEPEYTHAPQVAAWAEEAMLALRQGDAERAEPPLRRALAEEPDAPDLLNNLAALYELQGRSAEARTLTEQVHERYPDYLFARVSLARLAIAQGELERAHALLDPLIERKRLHTSEIEALYAAQIDLVLAEGKREGARTWLEMLEGLVPDSRYLAQMRRKVGGVGASRGLARRPHGQPR